MPYIDGFVLAVPTEKREEFRTHAEAFGRIFKEYGALQVRECWGEDVPEGETTSFPLAVKKKPDETVVFSWVEWPDKQTRNKAMETMPDDPRWESMGNAMPFDGQRLIFGGFEPIVDL